MKKRKSANASAVKLPKLELTENPDILKGIGTRERGGLKLRPNLVVGFAAETKDVIKYGKAKLERKGADWILANDVSPEMGTFGGDHNSIKFITREGVEEWPKMTKAEVANKLAEQVVAFFKQQRTRA